MKTEKELILDFLELGSLDRLTALTTILKRHKIKYEIEINEDGSKNVIVPMTEESDYILLVAHYDLFEGSTGINDNTASIATLIKVIKHFKGKKSLPFKVLFPDKEETGMGGSAEFIKKHRKEINFAIVLDIIGYGDTLVSGSKNSDLFSFLESYDIKTIKTILPSDNLMFNLYQVHNTLIVATHKEDIITMKDYNGELIYSLTSSPKFYESFHNRAMDGKIEVINFELIEHLRNSIIDFLGVDQWIMK